MQPGGTATDTATVVRFSPTREIPIDTTTATYLKEDALAQIEKHFARFSDVWNEIDQRAIRESGFTLTDEQYEKISSCYWILASMRDEANELLFLSQEGYEERHPPVREGSTSQVPADPSTHEFSR